MAPRASRRRAPPKAAQRRTNVQAAPAIDPKKAHPAVRSVLGAAVTLETFLGTTGTLTLEERLLIVDQAIVMLSENYVHLPLKRAMHAADPVQALRLFKYRLESMTPATMDSEIVFHSEMIRIFNTVRDLHTNYLLPTAYKDKTASMPFDLEEYYEDGERHYQVSHLAEGFSHPTFKAGVEITAWSGVPIERAVEINADRRAGSNAAARHARGLQYMAQRPLLRSLPPDEHWVEVDYIDLNGTPRALRFDWMVLSPDGVASGSTASAEVVASLGIDIEMELVTRTKRVLFAPEAVAATRRKPKLTTRAAAEGADVPTTLPALFRARSVTTSQGEMGHLRIFSFAVPDGYPQPARFAGDFVLEVERLIGLLPQTMLAIDVRGNGGGVIHASEGLLQLFTPRPITPEPTQFIVSPLNRRIVFRHRQNPEGVDLGPWWPSIDQARLTNAVYSAGFAITPLAFANALGQRYRGRVLCITDARCYSATDIFAAGFQDHEIGTVLGVDANTGAGGANVWEHGLLMRLMDEPPPTPQEPPSPYVKLPKGANMRVSIRRTLRVHKLAGSPLEDLGVEPDKRWQLTRNDLLNGNEDLLEHAAGLLAAQKLRVLDAVAGAPAGGEVPIAVTTANISRLDIYVDERPFGSRGVTAGSSTVKVPASAVSVRLDGYSASALVASNRIMLQ